MCFTKTTFQLTSQLLSWLPTINIDFSWSNTDLAISIRNLRVRNYFYVVVNPITVDSYGFFVNRTAVGQRPQSQ